MQGAGHPSCCLIRCFCRLGWVLSASGLRSGFLDSTLADGWQGLVYMFAQAFAWEAWGANRSCVATV